MRGERRAGVRVSCGVESARGGRESWIQGWWNWASFVVKEVILLLLPLAVVLPSPQNNFRPSNKRKKGELLLSSSQNVAKNGSDPIPQTDHARARGPLRAHCLHDRECDPLRLSPSSRSRLSK